MVGAGQHPLRSDAARAADYDLLVASGYGSNCCGILIQLIEGKSDSAKPGKSPCRLNW